MQIILQAGNEEHIITGDPKTLKIFMKIAKKVTDYGFAVDLPRNVGVYRDITWPGIGSVRVLFDNWQGDRGAKYKVVLLEGAIGSWLSNL